MNKNNLQAKIHVQCRTIDGQLGSFIGLNNFSLSPVFASLAELFPWMKLNGWSLDEYGREQEYKFYPWRVGK